MAASQALRTYLESEKVPFEIQHHKLAFTAQEVAASEHIPGEMLAKVVMVIADDNPAMLVLAAPHHASLQKAATALGATEVRLAQENEFASIFPDCELGAMPPFGNIYGVPVCVDSALADHETIIFNAGTHTDTISLRYADFARLANPAVVDIRIH